MSIVLEVTNQCDPSVVMQAPENPTCCWPPGSVHGHEVTCWQNPDGPGFSARMPSVRVIAPRPAVLYSASASEKTPPESPPVGHGCGFVAGIRTSTEFGFEVTTAWSAEESAWRPCRLIATCTGPLGGSGSGWPFALTVRSA